VRWLRSMRMLWRLQKMMLGMPGSQASASAYFGRTLSGMQQLIRGGAQSQQYTITDAAGAPVINFGVTPGSDPSIYGMQFLNPATGLPVMFLGVDASGAPGLHIYDPSGTEQVRLGELMTSPPLYGLGVLPDVGSILQQVAGSVAEAAFATQTISTYTGSPVFFSDGPSVTVIIGPSGQAIVAVGAFIAASSPDVATIECAVDGVVVAQPGFLPLTPALQATGANQSVYGATVITGMTPGSHTFSVAYEAFGTGPWDFSERYIVVEPL
jgi:hypothetical protein